MTYHCTYCKLYFRSHYCYQVRKEKEHVSHLKSLLLKKNSTLMCCAPKSFMSWVERPFIFSTFLSAFFLFYLRSGDRPLGKWKIALEKSGKIKGHSTQDINAFGAQHIKGALFFNWRLFEYDMLFFTFIIELWRVLYNLIIYHFKPLLLNLSVKFYWIFSIYIQKLPILFLVTWKGRGDGRYPPKFCSLTLLLSAEVFHVYVWNFLDGWQLSSYAKQITQRR